MMIKYKSENIKLIIGKSIAAVVLSVLLCFNEVCAQDVVIKDHTLIMIDSLNDLSKRYSFVDNIKALKYANEALELALSYNYDEGQAFAFRNMSAVYSAQYSFAESIEYIKKALDIFETLDNQEGIANCNISLGNTFNRLGQDSLAFEYHKKAYDFFDNTQDMERKSIASHNLGLALFILNEKENAISKFQKALEFSLELGNYQLASSCLSYLGEIEFKSENFESAKDYFMRSLGISDQLGPDAQKYAAMSALYHRALIHKNEDDTQGMMENLESALKMIPNLNFSFFVNDVYEEVISYYQERNNSEMLQFYTSQFVEILKGKNNRIAEDKTNIYLDLIRSRELDKKYAEALKTKEINEKIVEANLQEIRILVITTAVLAILLVIIVYQFFRNKKNLNAIKSIYNNAGTALVLIDDEGGIIRWNKFSEELFGEASANVLGKNFFREYVSKDSNIKPVDLEKSYLNEFRIIRKDGKAKEISISCSRTLINSKTFYVFYILDRSELNKLQRMNDFYQVILEKSNEIAKIGTWEMSYTSFLNKELPTLSSQVQEILEIDQVSPQVLQQLTWTSFFPSEEPTYRLMEVFEKAIECNKAFDLELNLISYKGNDIWIRFIGSVEFHSTDDIKLFGTVQDITDVKNGINLIEENLKKEQELNKLKSRFISMASHEFRTPLSTITSSVELIQMKMVKGPDLIVDVLNRHTASILTQVDRLEKTLDGILMLEKSIQGKIKTSFDRIDLKELFLELIETINVKGDHRKPKLIIKPEARFVMSDLNLLHHVLQNIISNSLKYSKERQEPEISVEKIVDVIKIEIKDYGIGIPDSDKSGLFSSFYRGKNTNGIKGTGLGLSIVKEFVTLIDAEISIESEEGKGTLVSIALPLNPISQN